MLSGELGVRKPAPPIFLHAAKLLDVPPTQCVLADDTHEYVRAAVALGIVGIHHMTYERTAEELEIVFGLALHVNPGVEARSGPEGRG